MAALLAAALWPATVVAEPLWSRLVPLRRVEADPSRDYRLTEENGPWLIMATTFSGEGALTQARQLVHELRRRYKLESYVHQMTLDLTNQAQGRGMDHFGAPVRMRYRKGDVIREIAVLVGDYPTVDDSAAQKALRKIKTLRPQSLSPELRKSTNQTLAALRTIQKTLLPAGDERKQTGPMGKAFLTRNPLLSKEDQASPSIDPLVLEMNDDTKYSLLDCPGKYTVKVATFTGTTVLDQRKVREYQSGKKELPSRLAEAADKAHRLTVALRKKGIEAYVFHDRYASIVTVGSFSSVGLPRQDGKIEINPQIHAMIKTFGAASDAAGSATAQTQLRPKTIAGIPLDIQPQIVHVPQRPALARRTRR